MLGLSYHESNHFACQEANLLTFEHLINKIKIMNVRRVLINPCEFLRRVEPFLSVSSVIYKEAYNLLALKYDIDSLIQNDKAAIMARIGFVQNHENQMRGPWLWFMYLILLMHFIYFTYLILCILDILYIWFYLEQWVYLLHSGVCVFVYVCRYVCIAYMCVHMCGTFTRTKYLIYMCMCFKAIYLNVVLYVIWSPRFVLIKLNIYRFYTNW